MLRILPLVFLLLLGTANAATLKVDTDEAGFSPVIGTQTLEMALSSAAAGDTILIDFSGSLVLNVPLIINDGVTIIGPAPIHFSIDGSNITGGQNAVIVNAPGTDVRIENISFINYNDSESMLYAGAIGNLHVKRCLFKDNDCGWSPLRGVNAGGTIHVEECSFYNNSATDGGGLSNVGSDFIVRNSSFLNNSASGGGGGIWSNGSILIDHCTFYANTSAGAGGAIWEDGGGMEIGGCLFDPTNTASSSGDNLQLNSGSLTSNGYNLLNDDQGAAGAFTGPGDLVGGAYTFGLRPTGPKQDGYGLWWIPITNPGSDARNSGGFTSAPKDGRRAPRVLEGTPDIGAIEFTPYRVTSNGNSPSTPGTFAYAVQQSGIDAASPAYISFDIGGASAIASSGITYNLQTAPVIIDGFTQQGSMVPGPKNATTPATAGYTAIMVDGQGSYTIAGVGTQAGFNNNEISGLGIVGYETGVDLNSNGNHVFGCHIGTDEGAADASNFVLLGINVNTGNDNVIGGLRPFERNTISGFQNQGIYIPGAGTGTGIYNNFFGVPGNGTGAMINPPSLTYGIELVGGQFTDINSNVFGNLETGIFLSTLNTLDTYVEYNIIGMDPEGVTALPLSDNGIHIDGVNTSTTLIRENYIGNCNGASSAGIYGNNCDIVDIRDNVIGLAGDGVTPAGNTYGIWITTTGTADIINNTISGNIGIGVRIEGSYNQVFSNFIGLDALGSASGVGNGQGIVINGNNNLIGLAAQPNYISDNIANGIRMSGSSSIGNEINGNYIGFEVDQTTPAGNGSNGIALDNFSAGNLIGNSASNFIGNNANRGVYIFRSTSNLINGNVLFDNTQEGIYANGTNSNSNTYSQNDIFNNGGLGIWNESGANLGVPAPEIIGATDCGGVTTVRVKLSGITAGNTYTIEFFQIPSGSEDPSGFGEGDQYMESHTVTAVSNGPEEFLISMSNSVVPPDLISATVTHPDGNTSEFSNHYTIAVQPTVSLVSVVNESCPGSNDGSIDVAAGGGSGTISFTWNDFGGVPIGQNSEDPTGLAANDYFLTVTDTTGCVISSPLYTVSSGSITLSAVPTDVTCNGFSDGQITYTVTGGSGAYDYSNDGGGSFTATNQASPFTETGLAGGVYDPYIVDVNTGCTATATSLSIFEPPAITFDLPSGINPTCNGSCDGSITMSASGGTPPLNYQWYDSGGTPIVGATSSTAAGLCAGSFYLEIEDANLCVLNSSLVPLVNPPALTLSAAATSNYNGFNIACNGANDGEITMTVSGGISPYDHSLDGGSTFEVIAGGATEVITVLNGGSYDPYVIDANGCSATDVSITLSEPAVLTANVSGLTDPTCAGAIDGTLTASHTGGAGLDYYDWYDDPFITWISSSPTLTTGAGTYYLEAVDVNGCVAQAGPFTLTDPAPLYINAAVTDESCAGSADGSSNAFPSGGTPGYSTDWYSDAGLTSLIQSGNPITGLSAGTYYVQITDGNSCQVDSAIVVGGPPALVYNAATTTDPGCNGTNDGSITLSGSGGTGTLQYSINGGSSFQSGATFTGLSDGTYSTVIEDANGCQVSSTETLTHTPVVTADVTVVDVDCFGGNTGSITATALTGGAPFTYSSDGGGTTQGFGTFTGLAAGTYDLQIADNGFCTFDSTITINEPPQLLSTSSSTFESCLGANDGTLSLTASGGTGPYTYNWYFDAGYTSLAYTNTSAASSDTQTGITPAMYFPQVIDANGCTHATGSAVVNTGTVITSNIAGTDLTCDGSLDGEADVSPTGGSAPYGVSWYSDPGLVNNIGSGTNIAGLDSGWVYVVIVDQGGAGCVHLDSVQLSSPPPLVYNGASLGNPACAGGTNGSISVSMSGGTAPYDLSTDGGTLFPYGGITASGLGAGTYNLVIVDDNGCISGPHSETLTDPAPITVDAGPDAIACVSAPYQLNGVVTVASGGSWVSAGSGSFLPNNSTLTATYTPSPADLIAGTVTLTLTSTGNGGCPAVDSQIELTVQDSDDPSFTYNNFCASDGGTPVVTGLPGGTFSFDFSPSNGETIDPVTGTISNAVGGATYVIEYLTNGTCPDSSSQSAIAIESPLISIPTQADPTCWDTQDGAITISGIGGAPAYSYSINGGTNIFPTASFTNLAGGTYLAYIEDQVGCSDTQTVVLNTPTQPSWTITNEVEPTCNGFFNGELSITASGGVGAPWGISIDGGSATIPANGSTYNYNSIEGTTYSIAVIDANGCSSDTSTYTLNQPDPIGYTILSADDTCALGVGQIAFTNLSGGTPPFEFSIDGGTSFQSNALFTGLAAGTYPLEIEDDNGCTVIDSENLIDQIGDLSGLFSIGASIPGGCPGDIVQLNGPAGATYNWSNNVSEPSIQDPVYELQADSNRVTLYITLGSCFGSDTINFFINPNCEGLVEVGNAFSPDGDGFNDIWVIDAAYDHPENTVAIFNRWGDLIVEFENYDNMSVVWDGKSKGGEELPSGTYFYTIDFDDLRQSVSGWVYITK